MENPVPLNVLAAAISQGLIVLAKEAMRLEQFTAAKELAAVYMMCPTWFSELGLDVPTNEEIKKAKEDTLAKFEKDKGIEYLDFPTPDYLN